MGEYDVKAIGPVERVELILDLIITFFSFSRLWAE